MFKSYLFSKPFILMINGEECSLTLNLILAHHRRSMPTVLTDEIPMEKQPHKVSME